MKHKGICHCGTIKFEFFAPEITEGVRCNCSLCERKGAIMAPFTIAAEEFSITAEKGVLKIYQFGSEKARHYFCGRCGVYPFHTLMSQPGKYRVNLGCISGINSSTLPFKVFDGASI